MRVSRLILAALLLASVAIGCRSKDAPVPAASVLAEPVAPATLLAELSLGNPKETWQRVRLLGGDLAQALPSSLPVLLTTSLSLPPAAAGNLDEGLPMVGALLSRPGSSEPDAVLGMHIVSGAELVASLTLGDAAKFRRVELGPRLVRLLPAPGAPDFNGALGVSGNYLMLATRVEALRDAGRFVAEVVPKRARTEAGLQLRTSDQVLSGSLSRVLRETWRHRRSTLSARDQAQRQAKGRAPDFADPEVLLSGVDSTVESWLGVLESSAEASLSLVPEPDRLALELTLLPGKEGAAALLHRELVVGPLSPLLGLPASAQAALLLSGEPAGAGGPSLGPSLAQLFGERLSAAQAEKLTKTFEAFGKSKGGATVVGLLGAPTPALVISCQVSDADAFTSAFGDLLRLVELGPVSSWLEGTLGKPSLQLSRSPANEHRARLRFRRAAQAVALPIPNELSVVWSARDGVGSIIVSPDPKLDLSPLASPVRLSSSSWLTQGQARLADQAALALYADARLLGPALREPAPLLLGFGKKADRIVVSAALSPAALAAIAGLFAVER